ncbi:MAG: hypothetical protein OXE17_09520 [Chloroflexi bacterium]|nr:hypothetical protein [Chloroflexota bacterium]
MMEERISGLGIGETDIQECQHHWVIQEADGPFSSGFCRLCGALKEFKNYLESSHWGDEKTRSESRTPLVGIPSKARVMVEDDEDF